VTQAARNLAMDLQDAGCRARFLIRDRDGKYPALLDTILAEAGIEAVLSGIQMPRMNSITERWIQSCRRELLDRTLVWTTRTCCMHSANTSGTITATDPTGESPTPVRSTRSPIRSQLRATSPDSTSADVTASPASSTSTNTPPELRG
jgi:hypothetical protein